MLGVKREYYFLLNLFRTSLIFCAWRKAKSTLGDYHMSLIFVKLTFKADQEKKYRDNKAKREKERMLKKEVFQLC